MISERQERLLNFLIKEYLTTAEPVGSLLLKKSARLDISPATVRNDLQALTEMGYISQPHTSAGRVPTEQAYRHFAETMKQEREKQFEEFIVRQVKSAHEQMAQEMKMMEELMNVLEKDNLFEILTTIEIWHKKR